MGVNLQGRDIKGPKYHPIPTKVSYIKYEKDIGWVRQTQQFIMM